MRKMPVRVSGRGFNALIKSDGELLAFLRKNFYSVFRKAHISGWRKCASWCDVLDKVGEINSLTVEWNAEVLP